MKATDYARLYVGKKEKPGNSGFQDPEFEKDIKTLGEWAPPMSWCCCFQQMLFRKSLPEKSDELKKLFDPSAVQTYNNFKAAHYPILHKPVIGALVIWQRYKDGIAEWHGHAGIVTEVVSEKFFKTIEGNTNNDGSDNGDGVYEKVRSTDIKKTGLNVLGFVVI